MMNRSKPMEYVSENDKVLVIKAFTDHKDKYGLDKDNRIYIYIYIQ